jgi:hypothetical protein
VIKSAEGGKARKRKPISEGMGMEAIYEGGPFSLPL